MSKQYGVPSKPLCRLCPCRNQGWPDKHAIPCSLLMRKAKHPGEKQKYLKSLSNDIAEELIRLDGEPPCLDCSTVIDESAKVAESGLVHLLEQEILGNAETPDYLPPSQHYQDFIKDVRADWGADLVKEFEAGTPAWMNESYHPLHNTSAVSDRYLSDPPSPSLDRWAPKHLFNKQRGSLKETSVREDPDHSFRRQSLPSRHNEQDLSKRRSLTKMGPYNRSPSKEDRSPMNKPSPLLAENRALQYNQRVVPAGQQPTRPRQAGEPGQGLLQIHRSPTKDPRHRTAPPTTNSHQMQQPDQFAGYRSKGVRTKSTYTSPSKTKPLTTTPSKTKPLTTGGNYPSVVIPGRPSTREVWQKLTVPQPPQANPHFKSPQNDAAEAYIVREAVKRQTARVCQEIIDRKHSLDLLQQLSPRETYEEQAVRAAVMHEKNKMLDQLKHQKNKFVAKLEEFSERDIGSSVGESSTTPLMNVHKDQGLVEDAKQLLQNMVPQRRPQAMRTTVNHNEDQSNSTMTPSNSESFLRMQADYEQMKQEMMKSKVAGKQPAPHRHSTPMIKIDQSSGITPPLSPHSTAALDISRLSVDGGDNDRSSLAEAEQRRLENNEQSRIMAESMAHYDGSVMASLNSSGTSNSSSMLQAREEYLRRVEEEEERREIQKRRHSGAGAAEKDEVVRKAKHRNSLVLNELLNRVDGIDFKTPTASHQSTIFETPHSLTHNQSSRPAPANDGSFYSIPDLSRERELNSPRPDLSRAGELNSTAEDSFSSVREMHTALRDPSNTSFSSVREMHTAMRDPSSSYYHTKHDTQYMTPDTPHSFPDTPFTPSFPDTPFTPPDAHSTRLGAIPEYHNDSLYQRYEASPSQHGPQSPIVIEITTNPTIISTAGNNVRSEELSLLNRSVEEVRSTTEKNRRDLGEMRELFEGVDIKDMLEVYKMAKNCKCGMLAEKEGEKSERAEETSPVYDDDFEEEIAEDISLEISNGEERPDTPESGTEGYTVL